MRDWIAFQIAGDAGQPLIFLHGIGGDAAFWRLQLEVFRDRFRAIAWDMPGYGDSPPPSELTLPSLATALELLLDRLKIRNGHLIGHGLGGLIGLEFAWTRPERTRSLTLAATAAPTGPTENDWRRRAVERTLGPLDRGASMAELAPGIIRSLVGDDPDPLGLEQAVLSLAAVAPAAYRGSFLCQLEALGQLEAQGADLARLALPVLLLAGEKDPIAGPSIMAPLAAALPGARFETLAGVGHLVNLEQPAVFNARLGAFLDGLARH